MMVGISKEDVLSWYQGLNASHRVEIICALLDHSLPFELRFLGSVIENLGRKDFHVLRDAECRANSLHSSESVLDQSVILKLLNEGPIPLQMTVNPQMTSSAGGHSNNASEVTSATRPNISQTQDKTTADENKGLPGSYPCENGLSSKISSTSIPSADGTKGPDKSNPSCNSNEVNSEDESDQRKEIWLHDWTKRRKLILYLSLLAATNHDSANLYYILMSDVEELMENLGWLEELEEHAQDEILLLYTVGSHHPAFNFEQRTFLSAVLNRFKECMTRYSKHCEQSFHGPCPPNQILNHHYLPPQHFEEKVGYYFYANPTVQNIQSSQSSSMQPLVGSGNPEAIRTPTYPFPYPSFPVFMSPPHPQHPASVTHHQQFQSHPYASSMAVAAGPTQGSVLQSHQLSQHGQVPPSSGNPQNTSAQLPGKVQVSSSNPGGPLPHSHQSSVSTPTRTSSMASAVTAYQSQANSLDGDSEGSSENCAWDSPESSPFESPPQSLTPSRSQSPRTGFQSKSSVHASTTMHSANITGNVASCATLSSSQSQPCLKADVAFGSSSSCTSDQGTSTATTVTASRPNHKSNIPDRKGRLPTVGGPGHNNVGQLSYSSPQLPPSSSIFSSATITTTTSTTSLTVTTVTSTPSAISSPLGKSQSLPTQSISHSQSTNLPGSHSAPQPCSTSNVTYSNLTSSGDCAQAHKNLPCSNSSGGLVTVGISSSSLSIVNTSAYNNSNSNSGLSISSPNSSYPIPLPQHHLISPSVVTASNSNPLIMNSVGETFYNGNPPAIGLVNAVNAAYGSNMLKSSSTMHSQSPQGRQQQKTNVTGNNQQLSNNHGGVQPQQSQQQQQHVIQQLMGQVVGQLPTSSTSTGVVTHSMNTPLLSYGHPGGHNNHGHVNYSAYQTVGVSYGNMGAPGNYRPNSQGPLLSRPAAYITPHPGSHLGNQMVMKQQQDQRVHSGVHPPMRQKNPSVMQGQNTPKRRTNNSAMSNVSSSSNLGGSNVVNTSSSVMLQSQGGKSEEATEINDRTNNVLVVSANPSKNSQHQQDNRGKIYHHPNSGYSNGPVIIDRVTSSGGISSSNSNTNPMMNSASGNSGANIVANTTASGQPLHNTQLKGEENLLSDGGVMDYGVATAYHSSGPIYGHPGPNAAFIPMQNGFLTPSYYPNHLTGPAIGMNTSGPQGPPSTEILMNPGHMQSQYPFTFPFTIPPPTPPHYGNPNLNNKAMCANNAAAKDASKTPLTVIGTVGSSVPNDSPKLMVNVNEPTSLAFGRPGPPTNTQSATLGGLSMTSPLLPMPSHSPMSTQTGRPRGVILEVGGQSSGAEFPSLNSLENALMPPLDDPLEVNCRPRKISCYNCGSNTHVGPECKEASMEEMTRKQYRLNYGGPPSSESKEGE